MSEDVCHVIIDHSRDWMSPAPDIVDLKGVFGVKYRGTYRAPIGFAYRSEPGIRNRGPSRMTLKFSDKGQELVQTELKLDSLSLLTQITKTS